MTSPRTKLYGALVGGALFGAAPLVGGAFWLASTTEAESACNTVPDSLFLSHDTAMTGLMKVNFDLNQAAVALARSLNFGRLLSAIKVNAAQQSVAGNQLNTTTQQAEQAGAAAVAQQNVNNAVLKAQEDYSDQSLSVNPCDTTPAAAAAAIANYSASTTGTTGTMVYGGPGSTVSGPNAIGVRVANHMSKYCSSDESAAGLCSGGGSNADVNFATLIDPNSSEEDAAAYLNNLVGQPVTKPTATQKDTPAGRIMMANAVQAEAVRSPAIISLLAVRGMYRASTQSSATPIVPSGEAAATMSVNQALDTLMSTYGGGPGYQAWDAELSGKTERGVQAEITKLRSISMSLRSMLTGTNTRTAAMEAVAGAAESRDNGL